MLTQPSLEAVVSVEAKHVWIWYENDANNDVQENMMDNIAKHMMVNNDNAGTWHDQPQLQMMIRIMLHIILTPLS